MKTQETKTQKAKRHMKVAALSGASATALRAGHIHTTARELRREGTVSPEGLASEA